MINIVIIIIIIIYIYIIRITIERVHESQKNRANEKLDFQQLSSKLLSAATTPSE